MTRGHREQGSPCRDDGTQLPDDERALAKLLTRLTGQLGCRPAKPRRLWVPLQII